MERNENRLDPYVHQFALKPHCYNSDVHVSNKTIARRTQRFDFDLFRHIQNGERDFSIGQLIHDNSHKQEQILHVHERRDGF